MSSHRPPYESVFHPSDFSHESEVAFCHALKLALASGSALTLLHAGEETEAAWQDFPGVRDTLVRWALIAAGSHRGEVLKLGISVDKVVSRFRNPVEATRRYLEGHPTDLIVLAAHAHNERMSWLSHSKAEPIARESHTPTLFIPQDCDGFVGMQDGAVNLTNVLVPIAHDPRPGAAIVATARMIESLGAGPGTIHLLHVGPAGTMPALDLPECPNWTWNRIERTGSIVDAILAVNSEIDGDLIAMSTAGHHGFLDALRGSTTERVLRHVKTPLLAVPPFR